MAKQLIFKSFGYDHYLVIKIFHIATKTVLIGFASTFREEPHRREIVSG